MPLLKTQKEDKEAFYNQLQEAIHRVPAHDMLLVTGDLNARVGNDNTGGESNNGTHYGIPAKPVNIIKMLYTDFSAQMICSNSLTDTFKIKTGVKQGCILSPFLFMLRWTGSCEK